MIDPDLYLISPAYRRIADAWHRAQERLGAVEAAYQNALNDQQRALQRTRNLIECIEVTVDSFRLAQRDDPGRGGSGGT